MPNPPEWGSFLENFLIKKGGRAKNPYLKVPKNFYGILKRFEIMCWPYWARLVFTSLPKGANKNFEKWENLDFEIF